LPNGYPSCRRPSVRPVVSTDVHLPRRDQRDRIVFSNAEQFPSFRPFSDRTPFIRTRGNGDTTVCLRATAGRVRRLPVFDPDECRRDENDDCETGRNNQNLRIPYSMVSNVSLYVPIPYAERYQSRLVRSLNVRYIPSVPTPSLVISSYGSCVLYIQPFLVLVTACACVHLIYLHPTTPSTHTHTHSITQRAIFGKRSYPPRRTNAGVFIVFRGVRAINTVRPGGANRCGAIRARVGRARAPSYIVAPGYRNAPV